jgi:hypothetical protein
MAPAGRRRHSPGPPGCYRPARAVGLLGHAAEWEEARRFIFAGINRNGTFLRGVVVLHNEVSARPRLLSLLPCFAD